MIPYDLTPEAEDDLKNIIRYTIEQWGIEQAQHYAHLLETAFYTIANNQTISRTFSKTYPQIKVKKCEHHYIFYLPPQQELSRPVIVAILHERMDLVSRLKGRLE
jgi:hypothetical protein